LRKDTLSHAYELMKVDDPRKRRRLAEQVANGELTLIKLRDKIEGRRTRTPRPEPVATAEPADDDEEALEPEIQEPEAVAAPPRTPGMATRDLTDDSLINAKDALADALDELVGVLRSPDVVRAIPDVDRTNLAKYLTIAKLRLENAIAIVRTGDPGD
jgi:hypothetical protein